jgi:hypothetical protein
MSTNPTASKTALNNPIKSDSSKLLLNNNNKNTDQTNSTNNNNKSATNTNSSSTTAAATNYPATHNPYSYSGSSSMMYPHLNTTSPYYYNMGQQQPQAQQQPSVYPYQQSTLYNYPQQYAAFQQQYNSQPELNKRYHF